MMDWETDPSLRWRMAGTLLAIAFLPLVFTITMSEAYNFIIVPVALAMDIQMQSIAFDLRVVALLTVVGIILAYFHGGKLARNSVNARVVSPSQKPELHGRVGRLAAKADMAKPDIALVTSSVPNAFATGRSPDRGTITVTTTLLETLDDDELDAVLAHELAHLRNRDAAVMSIAYLLPTFTFVLSKGTYRVLSAVLRNLVFTRRSRGDGRAVVAVIVLFTVTAVVTITISAVFWAASFLLFRLLSQYREFAADRGSAAITGNPAALASALETIEGEMRQLPDRDLRALDGGVESLYIVSLGLPLFNDEDDDSTLLSQDIFPESHPPTERRVKRLRDLAADLET